MFNTGYGNAIKSSARAITSRPGVAAIHLEDQATPKRCGHMSGKSEVPAEHVVAHPNAAVIGHRVPQMPIRPAVLLPALRVPSGNPANLRARLC